MSWQNMLILTLSEPILCAHEWRNVGEGHMHSIESDWDIIMRNLTPLSLKSLLKSVFKKKEKCVFFPLLTC